MTLPPICQPCAGGVTPFNTVNPFIQEEPKVSETGFYPYITEFNISDLQLQDALKFCYLITVIE